MPIPVLFFFRGGKSNAFDGGELPSASLRENSLRGKDMLFRGSDLRYQGRKGRFISHDKDLRREGGRCSSEKS